MMTGITSYFVLLFLYLSMDWDWAFDKAEILMEEGDNEERRRISIGFIIAGSLGLLVAGHWLAAILLVTTIFILQSLNKWFD